MNEFVFRQVDGHRNIHFLPEDTLRTLRDKHAILFFTAVQGALGTLALRDVMAGAHEANWQSFLIVKNPPLLLQGLDATVRHDNPIFNVGGYTVVERSLKGGIDFRAILGMNKL